MYDVLWKGSWTSVVQCCGIGVTSANADEAVSVPTAALAACQSPIYAYFASLENLPNTVEAGGQEGPK